MGDISIAVMNITNADVDAIVNAANEGLQAGGGVCGAIFKNAGHDELQKACDAIGGCDTGGAVITPGFALKARYVIHAVGPVWRGGRNGEAELLASCYSESIRVAVENGCKTIAFPLISSGIFGYPKEEAWRVALTACADTLSRYGDLAPDVTFCVLGEESHELGSSVLRELAGQGTRS